MPNTPDALMTSLEERVARAINEANVNAHGLGDPLALARAAIAATREGEVSETPAETYILWYEDAEVEQVMFSGHGAEEAAQKTYEQALLNWSCHLFVSPIPDLTAVREAERAACEAIARDGSFPFDIEVWRAATKKDMTVRVALAIADAIAARKQP